MRRFINPYNPVNWNHPLNVGLVSWWLAIPQIFSGYGTITWNDLCRKNNGTLFNNALWDGTIRNNAFGAVSLNGVNQYVDLGLNQSLKFGSGDFSYCGWILFDILGSSDSLIIESNDGTAERSFGKNAADNMVWFMRDNIGGAGHMISISNPTAFKSNRWYHCVSTRVGTNGYLYVDGIKVASGSAASLGNCDVSNTSVKLGGRTVGSLSYLDGKIDGVKIYNRGLSDQEVSLLYYEEISKYRHTLNYINTKSYFFPTSLGQQYFGPNIHDIFTSPIIQVGA